MQKRTLSKNEIQKHFPRHEFSGSESMLHNWARHRARGRPKTRKTNECGHNSQNPWGEQGTPSRTFREESECYWTSAANPESLKRVPSRGTWEAQSVMHLTLDLVQVLISGSWVQVLHWALCWACCLPEKKINKECFRHSEGKQFLAKV